MNIRRQELNEILNHEDFIILWIPSDNIPDVFKQFVPHLPELNSIDAGLNYINKLKSDGKIFLVLTDVNLLSNFENLTQIQFIYVFNEAIEDVRESRGKLIGVFEKIDKLIDRLCKDVLLTCRGDLPISTWSVKEIRIEQSLTNLQGNTLMFLWDQLFIYYLTKFPEIDMDQLKKEMVEQCRLEYADDQCELNKIDQFSETCSSENVLQWYSRDSFVYRLLNKAFRTRCIESICKFQYFIILLYEKFRNSSHNQRDHPSVVYRCQLFTERNIQMFKLNRGNLISMNTFLSTSRDEQTARQFILGATNNAAILKINIPNQRHDTFKPFIDISQSSAMAHEDEVLFFAGTVFLIDSVQFNTTESIWTIELTLQNEIKQQIETLVAQLPLYGATIRFLHHSFMKTDDFNMIDNYYEILTNNRFSSETAPAIMMHVHFAFLLSNLGLYTVAIQIYTHAISANNIQINSHESIVLHLIIGYLYYHSMDYDNAFLSYGIVLSLLDEKSLLSSELYGHIGDVWNKKNKKDIALLCYKKALEIANHQDFPSLPNIYRNMISTLETQNSFDIANVYRNQAEAIDWCQYHIPESTLHDKDILERAEAELNNSTNLTMIDRANRLYHIGLRLIVAKGDFNQALIKLLEAKELVLKMPPSWDRFPRHLSTLFDNIAMLHLSQGNYLKALTSWKQGVNIRCHFQNH